MVYRSDHNKKLYLEYAEFYITNVCNLTCQGCNRFNSFKFKGWQSWNAWHDTYQMWSQEIDLGRITIMGGEPLLNPEFYQWVEGISAVWPRTHVMIASNGTQLHRHKKLYNLLLENPRIGINVSIHNKMHKKQIIEKVKNFLTAPFEYIADTTKYRESLEIIDDRGIRIKIFYNWWFHQGAIIGDPESGGLRLHDSDPIKAHDICHSKTCHHFDHGRLYKCGPSALFSAFDRQVGLQLSDADRILIKTAPSIGIEDSMEKKKQFLEHINEPIPQCKFCPEVYAGKQIFAIEKNEA
jgi:organic radical activating enzyme